MPNNVIECVNLTHYYGKRLIYENLSFDVPKGRILGLLGKNGTGKTTAINILSGFLKPCSGECRIFGENMEAMDPVQRRRIGLLIEGHVQYQFMTIEQIEKFYSAFYPKWRKDSYYELMSLLRVAPKQRISRMSCGQRSQVALGLLMAQDPELLVLDDFSLGLDPGYRRLFVDYLRDYAKSGEKTVFLTSHIVQDMERLVDDCIIMDYGKILIQCPVKEILDGFKIFRIHDEDGRIELLSEISGIYHPSKIGKCIEFGTFLSRDQVAGLLLSKGMNADFEMARPTLEDAFISMTGKY